ncbi:hypothetical protein D9C73_027148 [Collichthys lucidus]|uniref:Uncharacterized protein n=1 Tax=Collichthys lucidus TaxID=240159 RepID=A0A4U5VZ29_COLLU|nr:hypothetical protein D9C73_027148 [Collichthys lucidus]
MIAAELSFTGVKPRFEAVDKAGVFPITEQYAAKCGYSVSVLLLRGHVELRASYFSCHTDNKDDEVFTFNFNLIATHEGKDVTYALNKTCSPSLPWSPREVTCEANYMEVSVRSEVSCPSGTKDDWNALKPAHDSITSDWQVMFQRAEEQLPPMNMSIARKQGYVFDVTNDEGSYADSGYMVWEIPEMLYPGLDSTQLSFGLNGELVEQAVAEDKGYIVEKHNATVEISIPLDADGGYRKSIVIDKLYEFYIFHLYFEQILVDEDRLETRVRFQRTLATPLLPRPIFTENQIVLEERTFTVYLGGVPADVELAAIYLNGQEYTASFTNASRHNVTQVVHPNNTHGYILKVPFDDPAVKLQFHKEAAVLEYGLYINFSLTVLPENMFYYHLASIALTTSVSPPAFDAVCSESGISFKLDHRPYDYLWEISIGSDLLTSELAAQHGYIMSNDSQSLLLDVPLFTHGYEYKNITLEEFFGTFEILVRDPETSEVQSSTIKTCPFTATELIMCSTDGRMTVVADLPLAIPDGGDPARITLIDPYCGPKEADGTRVLFSFPFNSCGFTVKLGRKNVSYENEIFYSHLNMNETLSNTTERVKIQCTYPLAGLNRLFLAYKFESDTVGFGKIIRTTEPLSGLQSPTIRPPVALTTTRAAKRPAGTPAAFQPAAHPPAHYNGVSSIRNLFSGIRKRSKQRPTCTSSILPPISNRTLYHPSFMPLYAASGFMHYHDCQTLHPIIPEEFYYTDPTESCGRRNPNFVTELTVLECFKLNTPPPIMSTRPAPPTRPDPFRSGAHLTRNLGSFTFKIDTPHRPVQPSQVVLELTQEEDQAITNLLKLHYQEPRQTDETLTAPHMDSHPVRAQVYEPCCSDVQHPSLRGHSQQGRCWSGAELDAANTLLSRFNLMEEVNIWSHDDSTTASTLPDPLPHQRQGSGTDFTQHDVDYVSFGCVGESGEQGWGDFVFAEGMDADDVAVGDASSSPPRLPSASSKSRTSVSRDHQTLSDSEGDAVLVLLSLGNVGSFDIVQ